MRIPIRTSRAAIWARRFAAFAIPLAVFSVLAHHLRLVGSGNFFVLLALVEGLALIAIGLALTAFVRLWRSGDVGWSKAIFGLAVGLVLLAPLAYAAIQVGRTPFINDVTTGMAGTPPLAFAANQDANPMSGPSVALAFPDAKARFYPRSPAEVLSIAENLVRERGWQIRRLRAPVNELSAGQINAIATTWLGWRDEVVIAVRGTPSGTEVNMRSASFSGRTDLGLNGKRIVRFLDDLDRAMAEDSPLAAAPGSDAKSG